MPCHQQLQNRAGLDQDLPPAGDAITILRPAHLKNFTRSQDDGASKTCNGLATLRAHSGSAPLREAVHA
jgi:hypothetical protein